MKGRNQRFVSGHKLTNLYGNKNVIVKEARICKHPTCTTKLSKYNKKERCWVHQDELQSFIAPRLRGRKSETLTIEAHVK